ncbi:hypothetical protein CRUP_012295 [Coryphaenoides rupestris]|nr:hypothetical protein CRUP_012295 [Coryphaenoides rupestris]
MFTWAELQQLNAGAWFLSSDPFGTGSSLSESERSSIQNQSIPSLAQFLEVAADSGRLVLFDLRRPPSGHPYNVSYINTTLQVVLTHINSSQNLTDRHIRRLNLHYSSMSQQQIRFWMELFKERDIEKTAART